MNAISKPDGALKDHAQQALDALKAAKVTIVTAESCTAGAVASLLSQAEGASEILHGGFITYTKEHKTKALGVPWRLLKEWVRFAAFSTVTAAVTATLINMGAAFAAGTSTNLLNLDPGLVKEPGYESRTTTDSKRIPNQVLDELTRGEPMDTHSKIENRGSQRAGKDGSATGYVPTSMLWPVDKYVPQLSKSLRG